MPPPRFTETVTLRLSAHSVHEADRLAKYKPRIALDPLVAADLYHTTRSDVLRYAIAVGLHDLAKRVRKTQPTQPSTTT